MDPCGYVPELLKVRKKPKQRLSKNDAGTKTRRKIRGRSNTQEEKLKKTGFFGRDRKRSSSSRVKHNTNHLREEDSGDEDSSSLSDSGYSLTSTEEDGDSSSLSASLMSDMSEAKRTAYPIFVVKADQLYLGIDKNKEGQGVFLEVTSKSISINDMSKGTNAEGYEVLEPNREVRSQ